MADKIDSLQKFLLKNVYTGPENKKQEQAGRKMIQDIFLLTVKIINTSTN